MTVFFRKKTFQGLTIFMLPAKIFKWLVWSVGMIIFLLVIAIILILLLPSPKEPTNKSIQQSFNKNMNGYKILLDKFRKDIVQCNLSFVSSESPERTMCRSKTKRYNCSLSNARWQEYQSLLNQLDISWIAQKGSDDPYYFVTYHESFFMNARLRGIVFQKEKLQKPDYPEQEWWPIQDGWYSFLISQ